MNKEFIPYEESLELRRLGFNELCICWHDSSCICWYNSKKELGVDILIGFGLSDVLFDQQKMESDDHCLAPTYSQAFRWFRENYDLHVQIRKENYFQQRKYEYYHFDISNGEESDITNQEDLLYKILDECSQDIPGNYLNDEMYSKLIFEKEFAFKTYEEAELACLRKLIELIK